MRACKPVVYTHVMIVRTETGHGENLDFFGISEMRKNSHASTGGANYLRVAPLWRA